MKIIERFPQNVRLIFLKMLVGSVDCNFINIALVHETLCGTSLAEGLFLPRIQKRI